jgi:hypothetical protein
MRRKWWRRMSNYGRRPRHSQIEAAPPDDPGTGKGTPGRPPRLQGCTRNGEG